MAAQESQTDLHILHVVKRFATGGLENGVVNIINGLSMHRHTVVSLTDADEIVERITNPNFDLHCLNSHGNGLATFKAFKKILDAACPDVVHTRNVGTIEMQACAALAGTKLRVHGEHGWDTYDPQGKDPKLRVVRRVMGLCVHRWIALSRETEIWLTDALGVGPTKLTKICNGVDTERLRPGVGTPSAERRFVTVTRLSDIKNPMYTVHSFLHACATIASAGSPLPTLVVVGDGPLMPKLREISQNDDYGAQITFVGQQTDVKTYLERANVFLLGSLREGISNTILEGMAMGLPTLVTNTGGNPELVEPGQTGELVPVDDVEQFAAQIVNYATMPSDNLAHHAQAARQRAERHFSIERMLSDYDALYRSAEHSKE